MICQDLRVHIKMWREARGRTGFVYSLPVGRIVNQCFVFIAAIADSY